MRPLYQPCLTQRYLIRAQVLLKDFAVLVSGWTDCVCAAAHQLAAQHQHLLTYLQGSAQRNELLAQNISF